MVDLPSLRRKYGPVFITTLQNGQVVPWIQLDIGQYLEYTNLLQGDVYAKATIEDEIFRKCVVDEVTIENIPRLKAGTVSTVVKDIVENSGPTTISELNMTLSLYRNVAAQAIHQTVSLITQAFPAYKLEDLYNMKYADFMLRLAQAEGKLLQIGVLEEPLFFHDPDTGEATPAEDTSDNMGAMEMYQEFLKEQEKQKAPAPKNQTIITATDTKSQEMDLIGHEKEDAALRDNEMLNDAALIYGDYLDSISSGEGLRIKTPEERLAEANKRAESNKQQYDRAMTQRKKKEKELEAHYAEIHKRFAAKKR